jgi:type IV pilus assembly protein PilV
MQLGSIRRQAGATLLEILVSVLILSLGILALVGLQARSINAASDAKYRVEATNYADQIVGQMWADRGVGGVNLANYPTFAAPSAAQWRDRIMGLAGNPPGLPGAIAPVIAVTADPSGFLVTVTVSWVPPGLPAGAPANSVVVQTRIDNP